MNILLSACVLSQIFTGYYIFFVKQRLTSLYPFSLTTTEQNTKIFKMCACVYVCVLQAMLMNEWMWKCFPYICHLIRN